MNRNAGGNIILVKKADFPDSVQIVHRILVTGRVSRAQIVANEMRLVLWNIHNFDLDLSEVTKCTRIIRSDLGSARITPTKETLWVGGD
jgi:hypothetical protein